MKKLFLLLFIVSVNGQSLTFDGTDDYAMTSVNSSSFFESNTPFTIEIWYKTTNGTHAEDNVMMIGTYDRSSAGGDTKGMMGLSIDPSNNEGE